MSTLPCDHQEKQCDIQGIKIYINIENLICNYIPAKKEQQLVDIQVIEKGKKKKKGKKKTSIPEMTSTSHKEEDSKSNGQ